ncbi:MAG: SDR family oxidoreductase [Parachlamydiales bacterium]|jgi:NAD(P)-dependent dehydrogenase (short-subunit alcohol dehydrogenase family)
MSAVKIDIKIIDPCKKSQHKQNNGSFAILVVLDCKRGKMNPFKLLIIFLLISTALTAEQKVVLISGASKGIGLATAKEFHAKGWKVWAGYRTSVPHELSALKDMRFCRLDVTDEKLVHSVVEEILANEGRIDALINNAGYGLIGVEESVTIEEAKQVFDVNYFGALRLTQAVLPTMRKQKSGSIVNISSGVGVHALPGFGLYSASKFALEAMTESLAATVAHWNIKVSVVEPGFVHNDWGAHSVMGSRDINEDFYAKLNRGVYELIAVPHGQPCEEVAKLLYQIVELPKPNVRYQTTKEMTEWVSEKFVDPTGMTTHEENLEYIQRYLD